jgi:hypothetical protein
MQVRLSMRLRILDALLKDILRLFHKLAMQVYSVRVNPAIGIVLSEDKFRSLFIILSHPRRMLFAFLRFLVSCRTVITFVSLMRLLESQFKNLYYKAENGAPHQSIVSVYLPLRVPGPGDDRTQLLHRCCCD